MNKIGIKSYIVLGCLSFLYFVLLFSVANYFRSTYTDFVFPLWKLQDSRYVFSLLIKIISSGVGTVFCFMPLGFCVAYILLSIKRVNRILYTSLVGLFSIVICFVFSLLFVIYALKISSIGMSLFYLLLPVLGTILGIALAYFWKFWSGSILGYLSWVVSAVCVIMFLFGTCVLLSFERKPLSFKASSYNSVDKRMLVKLVRNKDPRSFKDGQIKTVTIIQDDINKLLAWGLDIGAQNRKAKVIMNNDRIAILASVRLPDIKGVALYLNVNIDANVKFKYPVWIKLRRLQIGRINLPGFMISPFFNSIYRKLKADKFIKPLFKSVKDFQFSDTTFSITYKKMNVPDDFGSQLMSRFGAVNPMASTIHEQLDQLVKLGKRSPNDYITLAECMETVFSHAQKRSDISDDPMMENQAAIFALAILLGYSRIGILVGPVTLEKFSVPVAKKFTKVTISNRRDWTRHFFVSAALKLLSNIASSNAVGLLKEELDGDENGSGFSFADFLADRAGTTFAAEAVKDSISAIALQKRIISGFKMDDYFPSASNLPENIYDKEFGEVYGGIGGEKYNEVLKDIEDRIDVLYLKMSDEEIKK